MINYCPTVDTYGQNITYNRNMTVVPTTRTVYKYAARINIYSILFGGGIEVLFYTDSSLKNYLCKFQGSFGGIGLGGASGASGLVEFNYGLRWLAQEGWEANFQYNGAALAATGFQTINFWGLSDEYIGGAFSIALGGIVAVVGGRGRFTF
jgi:hypothetical protein